MELMGEEEPSKWRLLFLLLLSPGPVAEAALPAHSHASTYAAFPPPSPPPDPRRTPARLHASPPHPRGSCAAHPSAPWLMHHQPAPPGATKYCHRRLVLSLPEMPFSHRPGPHALAHTCTRQRARAQTQLLALKAIAVQAGTSTALVYQGTSTLPPAPHPPLILLVPHPHSAKKERAKNLLQHEKLITLVFSLAEWGCVNRQKR